MAKAESYNDLIFQLGDLARERLVRKPSCPRSMDRVLRAEQALAQRRHELAALEAQMNDEDATHQAFLLQAEGERRECQARVKQWKRAVDAIEGRVKDVRKKLATLKADQRYGQAGLKQAEARHRDVELTAQGDARKLDVSRENLKKLRIAQMRRAREIEELELQLSSVLTPEPGQPGAAGILAHRRLLELEDELVDRKAALDEALAALDEAIVAKERDLQAAEDFLDQAVFLLGEECHQLRISDPALAALYPRIDRVR